MTLRPLPLSVLFALACGPAASTTASDEDSTSSSDATTSTTSATTDDVATTDDDTTTTSTTTGVDPSSESSSTAALDTTETGDDALPDGHFDIAAQGVTQTPDGCAATDEGPPKGWALDFTLPPTGTAFALTETFGAYVSQYDCTLADATFTCARDMQVDYSRVSGTDAIVTLATSYDVAWDVAWDGDQLVGTYDADFGCTGTECASVVAEWNVAAFPCGLAVPFVATAAPGR